MRYELYLDTYLMTNFLMDITALILTSFILGKRCHIPRLILAGVLGSGGSLIFLLSMGSYLSYTLLTHLLVNPCMLLICFGWCGLRGFFKEWFAVYLTMMLMGGMMQWMYGNLFHREGFLFGYLITVLLGVILYGRLLYRHKLKGVLYQVTISDEECDLTLQAFYDTGNRLTDPYTKQPVSLIAKSSYQKNCGSTPPMPRLIPYHALGSPTGLIEVITVDKMQITDDKKERVISPAVLALAEDSLFDHQPYQMILHSSLLHNDI